MISRVRIFAITLGLMAALALPISALAKESPLDPTYAKSIAEFGPVMPDQVRSASVDIVDKHLNFLNGFLYGFSPVSPQFLGPDDSAWYSKADASFRSNQCNVLIDSVPNGGPGGCLYRVSVMCVSSGVGYVRGYAQQDTPIHPPLLIALYQPPSVSPAGYIEIGHLSGDGVLIGLNAPTSSWFRVASYRGDWCGR